MFPFLVDNIKLIGTCMSGLAAVCGGYVALDGPLPASKKWVIAQSDQLKSRLIDGSLQTNKLETYLLRKEKTDREIQVQQEQNPQVRGIYQNRLDTVNDDLGNAAKQKTDLENEKRQIK